MYELYRVKMQTIIIIIQQQLSIILNNKLQHNIDSALTVLTNFREKTVACLFFSRVGES